MKKIIFPLVAFLILAIVLYIQRNSSFTAICISLTICGIALAVTAYLMEMAHHSQQSKAQHKPYAEYDDPILTLFRYELAVQYVHFCQVYGVDVEWTVAQAIGFKDDYVWPKEYANRVAVDQEGISLYVNWENFAVLDSHLYTAYVAANQNQHVSQLHAHAA